MKRLILVTFVICIILTGCAKKYDNNLKVKVSLDSRIELVAILCYLSDYDEYSKSLIASYKSDVDSYFKDFRNHEAVIFFKSIREKYQTGYENPMSFAVYLTDSLTPSVSYDKLPKSFNPRWNEEIYYHLSELVKKFAYDSKFNNFFQAQKKKYDEEIIGIEKEINSSINFDWFTSFFGSIPQNTKFQIIVSLNNGTCSYGAKTLTGNGLTIYSINGAFLKSRKISIDYGNVIHEFCHPLCNPLIDEYYSSLDSVGKLIYKDYVGHKHQSAYGSWESVFYETFVRAASSCYIRKNGSSLSAWINNFGDKKQGFMWILPISKSFLELNTTKPLYNSKDLYIKTFIKDLNEYLKDKKNGA